MIPVGRVDNELVPEFRIVPDAACDNVSRAYLADRVRHVEGRLHIEGDRPEVLAARLFAQRVEVQAGAAKQLVRRGERDHQVDVELRLRVVLELELLAPRPGEGNDERPPGVLGFVQGDARDRTSCDRGVSIDGSWRSTS